MKKIKYSPEIFRNGKDIPVVGPGDFFKPLAIFNKIPLHYFQITRQQSSLHPILNFRKEPSTLMCLFTLNMNNKKNVNSVSFMFF